MSLPLTRAAPNDVTNFQRTIAIGIPIILYALLLTALVLTWGPVASGLRRWGENARSRLFIVSCVVVYILGLFVITSSGWGYALLAVLASHVMVGLFGRGLLAPFLPPLMALMGVYAAVMVGIPSIFSAGIRGAVSPASCAAYYGVNGSPTMCVEGWVVFVDICATCVVAGSIAQTVMAWAMVYPPNVEATVVVSRASIA